MAGAITLSSPRATRVRYYDFGYGSIAGVTKPVQRWNHNIHYHQLVVAAIPPGCQRVLDVGCGEGMLARRLARVVPQVVGIDLDPASIDMARRQDPDGEIDFICGDFLAQRFPPASFSMITSVAALHHMDARAALVRMGQLLAPGGRLVVIGLARNRLPSDLPWVAASALVNLGYRLARTCWEQPSPIVWPPPHSYAEVDALARDVLPGVRYRRHLLWRYSLSWAKPDGNGGTLPSPGPMQTRRSGR